MKDSKLIIVCATIVSVFLIGAMVLLTHSPDGGAAATRSIGLLITTAAPVIGTLFLTIRQSKVNNTAQRTHDNTERMLNGVMDEKIKNNAKEAVREVVHELEPPEK